MTTKKGEHDDDIVDHLVAQMTETVRRYRYEHRRKSELSTELSTEISEPSLRNPC